MTNPWVLSALWVGLTLIATLLAIWFRVSTALSEIVVGTVAQLIIGAFLGAGSLLGNSRWITFLAGNGGHRIYLFRKRRSHSGSLQNHAARSPHHRACRGVRPVSRPHTGHALSANRPSWSVSMLCHAYCLVMVVHRGVEPCSLLPLIRAHVNCEPLSRGLALSLWSAAFINS